MTRDASGDSAREITSAADNRQILVLGMHRSGTSAITGALARMGVHVGDDEQLTPKSWENPMGFFERREARAICDALLHSSGADWWKVSGFDPDNADPEEVRRQRKPIRELVASLDAHGHWALKEPRLCVLAPIFQSALTRPLAVIALRHPLEIARSLRRRNGFPMRAGLALWEAYMTAALRHSKSLDRVFIDYDELVTDPANTLSALQKQLEPLGVTNLDLEAGVNAISPELRREQVTKGAGGKLLSRAQASLWKLLKEQAPIEKKAPGVSDDAVEILREFEADEGTRQRVLAEAESFRADARRLNEERAALKAANERLKADARRLDEDRKALKATRDKLQKAVDAARREVGVARSTAETLERQLEAAQCEIGAVSSQRDAARAEARAVADRLEKQLDAARADTARLVEQRVAVAERATVFKRAVKERDERIQKLNEDLASAKERSDELSRRVESLRVRSDAAEKQLATAQQAIRKLEQDRAALMKTISWRFTAPLRAARHNPLSAWRRKRRLARLESEIGPLFDPAFYAAENADVIRAHRMPFEHFISSGWREGRRPNRFFDPDWYLSQNPDVAESGMNPLLHYARSGGREGRDPSAEFSAAFYLRQHADVADAGMIPLEHYLRSGQDEGRAICSVEAAERELARSGTSKPAPAASVNTQEVERGLKALERLTSAPAACVVIPVYNAPEETDRCLASVRRHTPADAKVIVLDDASPDERVAAVLERHREDPRLDIRRNPENLGFTGNVNKGMELAGSADVVLLNADTEVGPLWLQSLRVAAYSGDKVGTATPFSDNAGAFSAPRIGQANPLPADMGADSAARAVGRAALRIYPETPTGNGYCLYIRRACLDDVGVFDAQAFPRGYGEENDFCMRARKRGWTHVVDDAGYVRHVRNASFGEEKAALLKQGREVVDERHPDYTDAVRAFTGGDELKRAQQRVGAAISGARTHRPKPRVLYVLPMLSPHGGTPQTNRDLMKALDDRIEPWLLVCDNTNIQLHQVFAGEPRLVAEAALPKRIYPFPHKSDVYDAIVLGWLERHRFEMVHVRQIAKHSLGLIDVAKALNLPIIFSFHDFYTACPNVKLLDENGRHCAGRCTETTGECTVEVWRRIPVPPLKNAGVHDWRDRFAEALARCDRFVTTSESARSLILDLFPGVSGKPFDVIPHGRDFAAFGDPVPAPRAEEPLRILFPGKISYAKGGRLLQALALQRDELGVEIHVLGEITQGGPIEGVIEHGLYERDDFVRLASKIRPHVGAILSIWPETYCHTLTELWALGTPVIGTPFGAVKERIEATGGGWVLAEADPQALIDLVKRLRDQPEEINARRDQVMQARETGEVARSCADMAADYSKLYNEYIVLPQSDRRVVADRASFADRAGASMESRPPSLVFDPTPALPACSVVIPVHNALEDVRLCIESVLANTFPAIELVIVDDGSALETQTYLQSVVEAAPHVRLVRHDSALGYTRAINAGAKASSGEMLVFLNSDTIVPPFWLERLVEPMLDDEATAATGPVSNAATWQSVPMVREEAGAWAINSIPRPLSVSEYDRFILRCARGLGAPKAPLLNGFCYAVRRSAFEAVGGLDEGAFPSGYGEETDLLLRLGEAQYSARLNPKLYVFHAKSKSFGSDRRKKLSARGNEILNERWGRKRIEQAAGELRDSAALSTLRNRIAHRDPLAAARVPLKIAFLLPVGPGGGGVHSIAQEAGGLAARGHGVSILVREQDVEAYRSHYPALHAAGALAAYSDDAVLIAAADDHDVIVATHFLSVGLLRPAREAHPDRLFMYYVQDYEPWIVPEGSELFAEAFGSYGELDDGVLVAKTRWICRTVSEAHGVPVHKIAPSIEHAIYHDVGRAPVRPDGTLTIAAMLRPKTPRRAPEATLSVLKAVQDELGEKARIVVFGCPDGDIMELNAPTPKMENRGVLTREGVAEVLRGADMFVDMSTYQAFGRTALEAMACGAVAACPERGGGGEYAMDGRAALRLPTHDPEECARRVLALVNDPDAFETMRRKGVAAARQFSVEKAAASLEYVIYAHLRRRGASRQD